MTDRDALKCVRQNIKGAYPTVHYAGQNVNSLRLRQCLLCEVGNTGYVASIPYF